MLNNILFRNKNLKGLAFQVYQISKYYSTLKKDNYFFSNKYEHQYMESIDPLTRTKFWQTQAKELHWYKEPLKIFSQNNQGEAQWFEDGIINMCYNCIDRHLDKLGNKPAIYYESPLIKVSETITYKQLYDKVSKIAGLLVHLLYYLQNILQKKNMNINKGDSVIIFMPNIPETAFCMLACARIGAIHCVVYSGYSPYELARRIKEINPKLIISASAILGIDKPVLLKNKVDYAISLAQNHSLKHIIYQRDFKQESYKMKEKVDFDFYTLYHQAKNQSCEKLQSSDLLYILYTSGQSRPTFPLQRDIGGTCVALNYSTKNIFDIDEQNTIFSSFDLGWVVGHSFGLYGPLIVGGSTVIYEGKPVGTPDAGQYWRMAQKYKVKALYTFPSALKAIANYDQDGKIVRQFDLQNLKSISISGERQDQQIFHWIQGNLPHVLFNDNYWQTESGWPMISNFANTRTLTTFQTKIGSTCKPVPGFDVAILDENKEELNDNELGNIVLKLPLPPSFCTVYQNVRQFQNTYLYQAPGYYFTGDAGYRDSDGYFHILTNVEDIINISGIRLSTGSLEESILSHKNVQECVVVAAKTGKTKEAFAFVVLKSNVIIQNVKQFKQELIHLLRHEIGPFAVFKKCVILPKLPKNQGGKVMRKLLRDIIESEGKKQDIQIPKSSQNEETINQIIDIILQEFSK